MASIIGFLIGMVVSAVAFVTINVIRRRLSIKKRKSGKEAAGKNKKMSGLDKYIIFSFAVILIYSATQEVVVIKTGIELTTLTTCFFSVFGGEILLCALIKKLKLQKDFKKKDESEE